MAPFDSRTSSNKQHQLVLRLQQSIYSRLSGDEDVNDVERLSVDPAMRHVAERHRRTNRPLVPVEEAAARRSRPVELLNTRLPAVTM